MGARVDMEIVRAFADEFSIEEVREMRLAALRSVAGQLDRVEMTQVNFDLGSAAGIFERGKPEWVVRILTAVKDYLERKDAGLKGRLNGNMSHVDLSHRRVGW